tara:strand:- start:971 stop:1207 length:237 start_codon:yes stop_codon:yes gene_type:complete
MEEKRINVQFPNKKLFPAKSKRNYVLKTHRKEKEGWNFLNDGGSVIDSHMLLPTYPLQLPTNTKKRMQEKGRGREIIA